MIPIINLLAALRERVLLVPAFPSVHVHPKLVLILSASAQVVIVLR